MASALEIALQIMKENDGQRTAFESDDSCVVTACPGSGKTATLALKVMRLLDSIKAPQGLACLTFNNEAVREFRRRLEEFGLPRRQNVVLGTVHSFCLGSVIRPFGKLFLSNFPNPYRVANKEEVTAALARALDSVGINRSPHEYVLEMSDYRRTHLDRESPEWRQNSETAMVVDAYEQNLRGLRLIDFDDQVLFALRLIEQEQYVRDCLVAKFPWIAIDEYQDLGLPLHRIVTALLKDGRFKIFAVGDPDQSIYSFLGASPDYLNQLATAAGIRSISLSLNYRCGQRIINGAEIVLAAPEERNSTSSRGIRNPGEIFFIEKTSGFDGQMEAITTCILPQVLTAGVEPQNIGILYIDNNDGNRIAEHLHLHGVEFRGERDQRYVRSPITRWIEDLAHWSVGIDGTTKIKFRKLTMIWESYLRRSGKIVGGREIVDLRGRIFRLMSGLRDGNQILSNWLSILDEGLSIRATLEQLNNSTHELEAYESLVCSAAEGRMEHYTLNDFAGCGANAKRITLTTLHSSKGLQFDVVIIPGLEQGRFPWTNQTAERLRESRRTFYVGITRARYQIFLLYSGFYFRGKSRMALGPSQFLVDLRENLED